MTRQPTAPRNLAEAAAHQEGRRHAYRAAELMTTAPHLSQLDPWVERIKSASGIDLMTWADSIGWRKSDRCLYLHPIGVGDKRLALHAVLLSLGFKEVLRADATFDDWIVMQAGRLRLGFYLAKARPPAQHPLLGTKPENARPEKAP